MFNIRRLAIAGLLASAVIAAPAQAAVLFGFSFVAPLINGDTASGSGTLTTEDADSAGFYRFRSATGSFTSYAGDDPRTIADVSGIDDRFEIQSGGLYRDANGNFVTDGVVFFNEFVFDGIGFFDRSNTSYGGFFSEVGVRGASLTFTPTATAAVPEAATWAMMVVGFGAMGAAMRRRQRVTVRFA